MPLPTYTNDAGDGVNWALLGPLYYRSKAGQLWRICPSSTTDGPSIPDWAKPLLKDLPAAFLPGVFHDGLWRGFAEVQQPDGSWKRAIPGWEESTALFREALISRGMAAVESEVMYLAIMKAGGDARMGDMNLPIPPLTHSIPDPQQPDEYLSFAE